MLEKANIKEALNGKDFSKYITPYTLNAVLSSGSSQRYAVGDVIISTKPDDPTIRFGGTWQLLCPGRTMVCIDVNDSSFSTVRKIGGASTHTLTNEQLPEMVTVRANVTSGGYGNQNWSGPHSGWGNYQNNSRGYTTNQPHNNLQPYMVVYVWEKVA